MAGASDEEIAVLAPDQLEGNERAANSQVKPFPRATLAEMMRSTLSSLSYAAPEMRETVLFEKLVMWLLLHFEGAEPGALEGAQPADVGPRPANWGTSWDPAYGKR